MPLDFATVYEDHVFQVFGFFAYRVGSRSDAEDLTQVAFERALKAWPRYDPTRASPGTWLLAIARNILIDHYRSTSAHRTAPLADDAGDPSHGVVDDIQPDLGSSVELLEALGVLSDRDREVVAMRFGADLSGPEIAEVTGLSLANVQQILSRSLRRLREQLEGTDLDSRQPE